MMLSTKLLLHLYQKKKNTIIKNPTSIRFSPNFKVPAIPKSKNHTLNWKTTKPTATFTFKTSRVRHVVRASPSEGLTAGAVWYIRTQEPHDAKQTKKRVDIHSFIRIRGLGAYCEAAGIQYRDSLHLVCNEKSGLFEGEY